MKIGIIGLGRMGLAIAHRLINAGYTVYGNDIGEHARNALFQIGGKSFESIEQLASEVSTFWLMVPAGKIVDEVINNIMLCAQADCTIIDGGNSNYLDSVRRYKELKDSSINFIDCGTSGGLYGEEIGYSLMIGGDYIVFQTIEPILKAIAAPHGYAYLGPAGAGHFVKMVHNGIEYALLQAYAEGFDLLKNGPYHNLDLAAVSHVWMHGSIIRSWILELIYDIMQVDQDFPGVSGYVAESGMGKWTVQTAQKYGVPVRLIEDALNIRFESQKTGGRYATKLVALLRLKFGGHAYKKISE